MSDPVPVSAISTPGVTDVGPVGSNGTGGGKLLTAAEVRSFCSVYSTSQVDTLLSAKQDTLVSGTNLKTINSTSLLGSGDITVSASPGGSSGQVQYNNAGVFGGTAAVAYSSSGTHLTLTSQAATTVVQCITAAASQSANLSEWRTSAGTVQLAIARHTGMGTIQIKCNTGSIYAPSIQNSNWGAGYGINFDSTNTVAFIANNAECVLITGTGRLDVFSGLRHVSPSAPATAASAGVQGEIRWDSNYIYVCTATNTWKRVAIATW